MLLEKELDYFEEIVLMINMQGLIISANKAACKYLLCTDDEIKGNNINFYFDRSKTHKGLFQFINDILKDNRILSENMHEVFFDNQDFYKWVVIKNTQYDFLKIIGKVNKSAYDINKLQQQFEYIQETMPGNYWWKDKKGVYRGCNRNVLKKIGFEIEQIIGKTDYELPWSTNVDELVKNDNEVMRTGQPKKIEEVIVGLDGERYTFLVMKAPLRNNIGEIVGTFGVSFDISDRKKMEQDLEAAKIQAEIAKKQEEDLRRAVMVLAGSIAHDLRTPLATVGAIGFSLKEILPKLCPLS